MNFPASREKWAKNAITNDNANLLGISHVAGPVLSMHMSYLVNCPQQDYKVETTLTPQLKHKEAEKSGK